MKNEQLFGILDYKEDWFISLETDGSFETGSIEKAAKLGVVKLEEWLKTIKLYNIVYKVKAIQIEQV